MTIMIEFLMFYDEQVSNDFNEQTQKNLKNRHYLCENVTIK